MTELFAGVIVVARRLSRRALQRISAAREYKMTLALRSPWAAARGSR